jgi:hypothetical protein
LVAVVEMRYFAEIHGIADRTVRRGRGKERLLFADESR